MRRRAYHFSRLAVNWKALISFALLYIVAAFGIVAPLLRLASYLVMQAVGYRYLTAENVSRFVRHPLVFAAGAAAGILYAAFQLFAVSGFIYLLEASRSRIHATAPEAVRLAALKVKRAFRKAYRGILLAVLILTPVYHLGSAVNLLNSYSVFAGVLRFAQKHWYDRLGIVLGVVLLLLLFTRWMYVCHEYVLEDLPWRLARKRSVCLGRGYRLRQLWAVISTQLLLALGYMAASLAILALMGLFRHVPFISGAAVSSAQVTFLEATRKIFDALLFPALFCSIGDRYDDQKIRKGAKRAPLPFPGCAMAGGRCFGRGRIEWSVLAVSAMLFAGYMLSSAMDQFHLRIEHLRTVEVSAHRGASMHYPENTMAAFQGAADQGADWIELDVQESSDGHIFVMHDESLKRTTGVDKKSWEMKYYQIRQLDAGSYFNQSYAGTRVPLLREVIEFAREKDIRLNIELKPNGHEQDLVGGVLDVVEEEGFADRCVITSQKYDILRQVKERNEKIETVYVMGLAYGAVGRLKAADAFSIRSTSITQSLVTDLHNRGLEVYAWTVDSRSNINRMIDLGVDNIITNNVPLAIECINDSRTDSILMELLKSLWERF